MILKMRGLLIGDIREPTDSELRAWFEANRDDFTRPATISLDHVFYSNSTQVPQALLQKLQAGANHRDFGEILLGMGPAINAVRQQRLAGLFGPDAARGIVAMDDDQWHGPFDSVQGIHFVRITERTPAALPNYEQIKSYLEAEWAVTESRKLINQEVERIRDRYEVVIEVDSETER
jgi:hypothetical protein